ncbi:MAG: hypothetical protein AVDCRST_MAG93-6926, partial [uncultured Chloroflexia bacterium]
MISSIEPWNQHQSFRHQRDERDGAQHARP